MFQLHNWTFTLRARYRYSTRTFWGRSLRLLVMVWYVYIRVRMVGLFAFLTDTRLPGVCFLHVTVPPPWEKEPLFSQPRFHTNHHLLLFFFSPFFFTPRRCVPQRRTERFGKWRPFITAAPSCAVFRDKARARRLPRLPLPPSFPFRPLPPC